MGSLKAINPLPPEDIGISLQKLDIGRAAMDYVTSRGLTFPSLTNDFRGELPPNVTHLDDAALGQLLSYMATYCGYVEAELSKTVVERNVAEACLEQLRSGLRESLRTDIHGKLTVQDKTDKVECDPRVVDAKARFLFASSIHAYTKTILDMCQRNWDTLSRHITQRGQQVDRMVRGNNMAAMPNQTVKFRR